MRPKRSSVPAGFPSASASSAKDNPEEKGKHFLTMAVQTLQDLSKRLVQKLDWANLTSTTKRNLKIAGIVVLRQNSMRTENSVIPCHDGCLIQVIPSPSNAKNLSR
jgi:hypothetical protein